MFIILALAVGDRAVTHLKELMPTLAEHRGLEPQPMPIVQIIIFRHRTTVVLVFHA